MKLAILCIFWAKLCVTAVFAANGLDLRAAKSSRSQNMEGIAKKRPAQTAMDSVGFGWASDSRPEKKEAVVHGASDS